MRFETANNELNLFLRGDNQYLLLLQVVSLCWSHGLYDAIIYVYNKGMFDYSTRGTAGHPSTGRPYRDTTDRRTDPTGE